MKPPRLSLLATAIGIVLIAAGPVHATPSDGGVLSQPVFGSYWHEFIEFWKGVFQKQNGIVMGVLCVGAVALFIITRGKWRN
jgi:hypothetical protein